MKKQISIALFIIVAVAAAVFGQRIGFFPPTPIATLDFCYYGVVESSNIGVVADSMADQGCTEVHEIRVTQGGWLIYGTKVNQ